MKQPGWWADTKSADDKQLQPYDDGQAAKKAPEQPVGIRSVSVTFTEWILLRRELQRRGWSTPKMTAVVSDKMWDANPIRIKWHANLYGVTERPQIFADMLNICREDDRLEEVRFSAVVK